METNKDQEIIMAQDEILRQIIILCQAYESFHKPENRLTNIKIVRENGVITSLIPFVS